MTQYEHLDYETTIDKLHVQLNALSEKGWELVSAINLNDFYVCTILLSFKRPVNGHRSGNKISPNT
jgi:hypothetical protein